MPAIPLFLRSELEAAFGQILPPAVAKDAAARWWDRFADLVDAKGYFLYEDPLEAAGIDHGAPRAIVEHGAATNGEQRRRDKLFWGGMSIEERLEILMRFSSFHFGLIGLLSDELHERMRTAQGMTPD